jgi:hypothetical protein
VTSSKLSFLEGQEQGLPDVALEALRSPVRVTP